LAEERRNQTLWVAFFSRLGAGEVYTAAFFLSAALIRVHRFAGLFPMLALPISDRRRFLRAVPRDLSALPALMLLALAAALLGSVLTRTMGHVVWRGGGAGCASWAAVYLAQSPFSPGVAPISLCCV